ncbi:MAG: hypothetical protein IKA67_01720 [Clostridia bacterium]|nr:hypothetical protein [Clostridia bacterium]
MKKTFMCSLCRGGIIGGALYLTDSAVTYRTNKLTVDPLYRNLTLSLDQIESISWRWIVFPIATFHMKGGAEYSFIIFGKSRFCKCYSEIKEA